MRNLKITLMLLALVGLIAVAGCGGGGDSSSDSSSSTATESTSTSTDSSTATDSTSADNGDYAQQLTTILTDFGTTFQTLGTKLQSVKDESALSDGINQLEDQIQTTITDLKALDAPPEAQEGQDQIISAFEAFSEKLTAVGDAVDSGDASAAKTAAQDLQTAAQTFQQDFSAGIQQITQSGVQVGSGSSVGG